MQAKYYTVKNFMDQLDVRQSLSVAQPLIPLIAYELFLIGQLIGSPVSIESHRPSQPHQTLNM